jgi:signal transduction histidine kinase/ActR/RegA family two-component response regulator
MDKPGDRRGIPGMVGAVLGVLVLTGIWLLAIGNQDYPDLHVILDTGAALLSGVLALVFFDVGRRIGRPFPKLIAACFAATSLSESIHVLVTVEWSGPFLGIVRWEGVLRPATWPTGAYVLPVGVLASLFGRGRGWLRPWILAIGLSVLGAALLPLFIALPRYTSPGVFAITRPSLILVPVLWAAAGIACWRIRLEERMAPMLALASCVILVGNLAMLYSMGPHDTNCMAAHLVKVAAYLALLLSLMQLAAADMAERLRAERELVRANEGLEGANRSLAAEVGVRRAAEEKVQAQNERLNLLHHINRAIGDRQDLRSIFQVVIRSLEDQLPVDFTCVCLYDIPGNALIVTSVGIKSEALATELAMTEQARIPIDQNGLSRCVRGQLVHEPDISEVAFPFPQRLARASLRSLVAAPLLAESRVFGVLIAARLEARSFSSGECEFLRQLSEHVALAAHHAQLYKVLQQAYDDLAQTQQYVMQQERLRVIGQMASGIAHDINNAMSPVALYTESLLEQEPGLSARARKALETIQRAVDDVAHTVSRMREFSRQRVPEIKLSPVSLNGIVHNIIDLTRVRWSDMALRKGIVVEMGTDLAADLPPVLGIESEIREALTNLVFNAVDAMPAGGTLTLRTCVPRSAGGAAARTNTVWLEVSDSGIGMDEDTRRRCLEPFFTTKGERGTGLGLAMVYGVAKRHDADIEIESAPGKGTTIRLAFPVAVGVLESAQPLLARTPPSRIRILAIDDDPLILRSLLDALEREGHQIITANGGQAGIDAFRAASGSEPFDIVITDLGMPYVDGRKVASAIKETAPATPVILLTGWGERLLAEGDVPLHVDQVLGKPPRLRELRDAFARLCGPGPGDGPTA